MSWGRVSCCLADLWALSTLTYTHIADYTNMYNTMVVYRRTSYNFAGE